MNMEGLLSMLGTVPGIVILLVKTEGNLGFHLPLWPSVVYSFLIWSSCEKVVLYHSSEYIKEMSFAVFSLIDWFICLATTYWSATYPPKFVFSLLYAFYWE